MFGIGLGEVLVILLVIFLVAPAELPKAIRKLAELKKIWSQMASEVSNLEKDIREGTPLEQNQKETVRQDIPKDQPPKV